MTILVTGSAGFLGEALVRTLRNQNQPVMGIDRVNSEFTDKSGTIADRKFVRLCMQGIDTVIHTATLHKPHVATHQRQEFIDVNVTGTLNLLEESLSQGVKSFVFTSTTSTFGDALTPSKHVPATWVTEDVVPIPKNIYGVTKVAAEDLCYLFHRNHDLACIVLRTSRFFREEDDRKVVRERFEDDNIKANEYLYRRVDIEDVVSAHLLAMQKAHDIGFARYIISATTPFLRDDVSDLRTNAAKVLGRRIPEYECEYQRRGWQMFSGIDRVYVNQRARDELDWAPRHDFAAVMDRLSAGGKLMSELAYLIPERGYHARDFPDGPYPVESTGGQESA